jgi:hypothetical protein
MVKKLPDTNERDGGTSFNKSANIFAKNLAITNRQKYADLRYDGSLFPLTSAEHPPTTTLCNERTCRANGNNHHHTGDFSNNWPKLSNAGQLYQTVILQHNKSHRCRDGRFTISIVRIFSNKSTMNELGQVRGFYIVYLPSYSNCCIHVCTWSCHSILWHTAWTLGAIASFIFIVSVKHLA